MTPAVPPAIDGPGCLRAFVTAFHVFLHSFNERKKVWTAPGVDAYFANYLTAWTLYEAGLHKHPGLLAAQEWFKASRNSRGLWGGGDEGPELESTARACVALLIDPTRPALDHVRTAIDYLLGEQTADGWWPGEFLQHRSNQPYYGAMLPISFALRIALRAGGQNERLSAHIRESQQKLRTYLEQRFERGEFAIMGVLDENPVRALSWGVRMYLNAEGDRPEILNSSIKTLSAALQEPAAAMNLQDLYNAMHSLALLGVPVCEPAIATGCREIESRIGDGFLQGSEQPFRYSGGVMLAYLHIWRAHPISECFLQFLTPLLADATEGAAARLGHAVREHWIALAGLVIATVSAGAAIMALWR